MGFEIRVWQEWHKSGPISVGFKISNLHNWTFRKPRSDWSRWFFVRFSSFFDMLYFGGTNLSGQNRLPPTWRSSLRLECRLLCTVLSNPKRSRNVFRDFWRSERLISAEISPNFSFKSWRKQTAAWRAFNFQCIKS